jgi:hypothetical protein
VRIASLRTLVHHVASYSRLDHLPVDWSFYRCVRFLLPFSRSMVKFSFFICHSRWLAQFPSRARRIFSFPVHATSIDPNSFYSLRFRVRLWAPWLFLPTVVSYSDFTARGYSVRAPVLLFPLLALGELVQLVSICVLTGHFALLTDLAPVFSAAIHFSVLVPRGPWPHFLSRQKFSSRAIMSQNPLRHQINLLNQQFRAVNREAHHRQRSKAPFSVPNPTSYQLL